MAGFPHLTVRGDARERGRSHGEAFRERIERTCAFYLDDLFSGSPLDRAAVRERADRIESIVRHMAPVCAAEIDGIAAGAAMEPWKVYVLNGRTEILNARVPECTAFYFAETRVLAQNWDWVEPLEDLVVVITHERDDGRRHVAFIEPGMVGKIGMNDSGVGVCLNILFAAHDLNGLPVHVLNGALLGACSCDDARTLLESCGTGKASHILVGDAHGQCVSMEFMGEERLEVKPSAGVLLHTNHCLAWGEAGRTAEFATSCGRYDEAERLIAADPERDYAAASRVLLSRTPEEEAINRPYRDQFVLGAHRVGTCATVIMELEQRRFHVKRGPGVEDRFETWEL